MPAGGISVVFHRNMSFKSNLKIITVKYKCHEEPLPALVITGICGPLLLFFIIIVNIQHYFLNSVSTDTSKNIVLGFKTYKHDCKGLMSLIYYL